MKMQKAFLTLVLVTAASAVSVVGWAGVPNPDNDSGTYFTYKPSVGAANTMIERRALRQGEVSSDGLYVYTINRGWVNRDHTYVVTAGRLEHSADCLIYNTPKPAGGSAPSFGPGGDHA